MLTRHRIMGALHHKLGVGEEVMVAGVVQIKVGADQIKMESTADLEQILRLTCHPFGRVA